MTNQTDANVPFSIFVGTENYYTIQVVDYNIITTDREYIPREYIVKVPFGTDYTATYTIQPHLLSLLNGVTPTIYVFDKLKRSIQNVGVLVYKSIEGNLELVQSSVTTSLGRTSISAYPFDTYIIKLYYKGVLSGDYTIQPRASTDAYYFVIDTIIAAEQETYVDSVVDWSETDANVDILANNPTVNVDITLNSNNTIPELTSYTIHAYQNSALIISNTESITGSSTSITSVFDKSLFNTIDPIIFVLDYNYTVDGEAHTLESKRTMIILDSGNRVFEILQSVPNEIGSMWAILLSILITISLLVVITFTGFVTDTRAITIIGVFILGIFLFLGWLNTGVEVMVGGTGTDVIVFAYVLAAIFGLFLMLKGGNR
jgi:hypothetical protein